MSSFPFSWFWIASDGRIYSASAQTIYAPGDPGYPSVQAAAGNPGGQNSPWPLDDQGQQTDAALAAVLGQYGLSDNVKDALVAYAGIKQSSLAMGGYTKNVASSGAPLNVQIDTDTQGQANLMGAVQLAAVNPQQAFNWVQASGIIALNATQILAMGVAVGVFFQNSYTVYGQLLGEIEAGTVTTKDQIDATNWPANAS